MALAASIIPALTSNREFSNSRAKYGLIKVISGTSAAVVPILVPTMAFVTGRMKTRRITNGIERRQLMTVLVTVNTTLFSLRPFFLVSTRIKARMKPITEPKNRETKTIYRV